MYISLSYVTSSDSSFEFQECLENPWETSLQEPSIILTKDSMTLQSPSSSSPISSDAKNPGATPCQGANMLKTCSCLFFYPRDWCSQPQACASKTQPIVVFYLGSKVAIVRDLPSGSTTPPTPVRMASKISTLPPAATMFSAAAVLKHLRVIKAKANLDLQK